MGLEVAAIAMAAVATGATVGKMGMEISAADSATQALEMQAKQGELLYQQKTLSNLAMMDKVLDEQTAAMTTRGVAFSSPSFNAIQRATLNIGAKKQKNTDIEQSFYNANLDIEKENVKTKLYASLFGDVASVAGQAFNVYSKTPRKLPQMEA